MTAINRPARFGKKLLRILTIVFTGVIALLGVLAAIHHISTALERPRHPAPGMMVTVHGEKMHVYTEGAGDDTFVVLSGGGIGEPVLEYKPLWSRLARHGRVAMVEYFGYGWSETTDAPRTAEKVVEEIREALKLAGVQPPYVLVPHSMSGIYAMAYAQTHREELKAIIALDTTLPRGLIQARAHGDSMPTVGILPLLRNVGILRAALWFNPLLVSGAPEGTYSKEDARLIATVTGWNYGNQTLENEYKAIEGNMEALLDVGFPKDLPVLMVQAAPPGRLGEAYEWAVRERTRLTKDLDHGKVVELPAGHSGIYWQLSDRIVEEALRFLNEA
jgi:pimeloyl-ACP methyl ester carboxylesterase